MGKRIAICSTSIFAYDQRMQRISSALAGAGHDVIWVGRGSSASLSTEVKYVKITTWRDSGPLFYLSYAFKVFFILWKLKPEIVYAVDTDTLPGAGKYAWITKTDLVLDAHEYYLESPELRGRGMVRFIWQLVELAWIPQAKVFITVNDYLGNILSRVWNKEVVVVRNLPILRQVKVINDKKKIIIYQGVLNVGRGLELAIDAMSKLQDYKFWIIGEGDIKKDLLERANASSSSQRIKFFNHVHPNELHQLTQQGRYGLNMLDGTSLNYKYSLANKFFDYMAVGVPSINMDFPLYKSYCDSYGIGLCVDAYEASALIDAILEMDSQKDAYTHMVEKCTIAFTSLNWDAEKEIVISAIGKL